MLIARHETVKSVSINNYIRHARVVMNKAVDWGTPGKPFEKKSNCCGKAREPPRFIPPEVIIDFYRALMTLTSEDS